MRGDGHGSTPIVLRGVIDCVAVGPDGEVTVLDFKTGTPRAADAQQLASYVRAAQALFPGATVAGRLVYPQPPVAPDPGPI
jgi:RecB family exonuclease